MTGADSPASDAPPAPSDDSDEPTVVDTPDFPAGHFLELPDLGTIVVRDFGPRDGRPLILLHGWTATADINWFRCYSALGERYRVVAYDHRGHGSGLRGKKRFRLEDCADDAVAVADALGIPSFTPIGYSMGGPIAQLVWRRHPERVEALVLCATAPMFQGDQRAERWSFLGLSGLASLARVAPDQARVWLTEQLYLQRKSREWAPWAIQEVSSHDWRMLLEAGAALGSFSSVGWIGKIDVPVSLLVTTRDQVVPRHRQAMLFDLIEHARAFRIAGDHNSCVDRADRFVPALVRAIESATPRRLAA
ncbi:MAG: alpha/beta hydrolase [Actinomycetota bacterium]